MYCIIARNLCYIYVFQIFMERILYLFENLLIFTPMPQTTRSTMKILHYIFN